jgi:hypothetical protein
MPVLALAHLCLPLLQLALQGVEAGENFEGTISDHELLMEVMEAREEVRGQAAWQCCDLQAWPLSLAMVWPCGACRVPCHCINDVDEAWCCCVRAQVAKALCIPPAAASGIRLCWHQPCSRATVHSS